MNEILPEITKEKKYKYMEIASSYGDLEGLETESIATILNDAYNRYLDISINDTHKLLTYKKKTGYGSGEAFIEFTFNDASTQGGSTSYDITAGMKNFEVKSYPSVNSAIRLGKEGTVTNFKSYILLLELFLQLNRFILYYNNYINNDNYGILSSMINEANAIEEYNVIIEQFNSKQTNEDNNISNLSDLLLSGEFNRNNISKIDKIFTNINILVDKLNNTNYEYVKLINKNKVYCVKADSNGELMIYKDLDNKGYTIKTYNPVDRKEGELELINTLGALKVMLDDAKVLAGDKTFLEYFSDTISDELSKKFKTHPLILMNDSPTKTNIACFGVYTNVKFHSISQSGVKIKV